MIDSFLTAVALIYLMSSSPPVNAPWLISDWKAGEKQLLLLFERRNGLTGRELSWEKSAPFSPDLRLIPEYMSTYSTLASSSDSLSSMLLKKEEGEPFVFLHYFFTLTYLRACLCFWLTLTGAAGAWKLEHWDRSAFIGVSTPDVGLKKAFGALLGTSRSDFTICADCPFVYYSFAGILLVKNQCWILRAFEFKMQRACLSTWSCS